MNDLSNHSNKKEIEKNLGDKWNSISLSDAERETVRANAILRGLELSKESAKKSHSIPSSIFSLHAKAFTFSLLGVIFVGAGISYAAEYALPGEITYPIKTTFNESIIELMAFTDESAARAKVSIVERRGKEIEQMMRENSLTDEAVDIISKNIERHVKEALATKQSKKSIGILVEELSDVLEDNSDMLEDAEFAIRNKRRNSVVTDPNATTTQTSTTTSTSSPNATTTQDDDDDSDSEPLELEDSETIDAIDEARERIEDLNMSVEALGLEGLEN